ncbi:MAG TPA: carboxylating nicotinate-nucleotide diphosphorylase [Candidatus Sabulitectum sp.]|nr:carboxylating nicotinate-nucleotide diphosphorylase [Candidatus Sabulitectum sp.]HPF33350.1 carboxylating nicotinate-nucleotide diphosphorylase [Candidatus Sabulitectum sp.]
MKIPEDWTDSLQNARFVAECALLEDRASEDSATWALGGMAHRQAVCTVNAREGIVLAGLPHASLVFQLLPGGAEVTPLAAEGERVPAGGAIAVIRGTPGEILRGERVFLNILGRLCGIATMTARFVEACHGTGVEILDTRKTTPCMRAMEKYAVRTAGGTNHRFSLFDMAMLKDNHLAAAGGVAQLGPAMARLRERGVPVEIEVDGLDQLREAILLKPQRILLDNMDTETLSKAVAMAEGSGIYLEASGGITLDTLREVALTGVHGISSGALTHSVRCSDIGFDWDIPGGV